MQKYISIRYVADRSLNIPVEDEKCNAEFERILEGLAQAKKKGLFFQYNSECAINPEKVIDILKIAVPDGQENISSEEGHGQEAK